MRSNPQVSELTDAGGTDGGGYMNKRKLGSLYEERAAEVLKQKGYRILKRNYRCHAGEIDLIAWKEETLIFIEVKYRATEYRGLPEEAVGLQKQRRISKASAWYLMEHQIPMDIACRFDVVSVLGGEVRICEHAFEYLE